MAFINPIIPLNNIKPANNITMSSSKGNIPVAEYIECIKKIEADFPNASSIEVLGSLRRLYYDGIKFSRLIPDSKYISIMTYPGGRVLVPIRSDNYLPQWNRTTVLEKLKLKADENGSEDNPSPYIVVYNNGVAESIDVGHLLLTFDALINPTTAAPYSTYGILNKDPASWVADIAIAAYWKYYFDKSPDKDRFYNFAEFINLDGKDKDALRNTMKAKGPSGPTSKDFFDYSAPNSDLLGDIDGYVIKHFFDQRSNYKLSRLFAEYYLDPLNRKNNWLFKRYWFFCFLNEFNYNYGTRDWTDINKIYIDYLPRITAEIELFIAGYWSAATVIISSIKPITDKSLMDTTAKLFLQMFLNWLKPRLQKELQMTLGNSLPTTGNMLP